ncbi:MAG: hypothetical protein MJ215_07155 [Spirochaetia bacterium]|nr:hypothetical protein [Spirochaetia bacterium]
MCRRSVKIPGKIIISGEHSVVHGCPALSCACTSFIHCHVQHNDDRIITIVSPQLNLILTKTFREIEEIYQNDLSRLEDFRKGIIPVTGILEYKSDILFHAAWKFISRSQPDTGATITLHSDIPTGAGMGSSAAASAAIMAGLCQLTGNTISREKFIEEVTECENLIHGRSSGLDPATVINSGLIWFQDRKAVPVDAISDMEFIVINTGKPESTTGEAVYTVRERFTEDMKARFTDVTLRIKNALTENSGDISSLADHIRENQLLLEEIGVVPQKVADFAGELYKKRLGFKICGAGAVRGNGGGIGILFCEKNQLEEAEKICRAYGYTSFRTGICQEVLPCLS